MHFENCTQGHISKLNHSNDENVHINTDIDPGCDFVEPSSGRAFIKASPGSSFRKPDPGSSYDSSYVGM